MPPTHRISSVVAIGTTLPAVAGDGTPEFVLTFSLALPVDAVTVVAPTAPGALRRETIGRATIARYRYALFGGEALTTDAIMPALRARPALIAQVPGLLLGLVFHTVREVRRQRPDLIHAHWLVPGGVAARITSRLTGVPYIVSAHGADIYTLQGRIGTGLKRWVMRGACAVFPVSEEIGARLDEIHSATTSLVIPMGVDIAQLRADAGPRTPAAGRIVFVGRLADKKGVDVLIEALAGTATPCHLTVIGDGPDRSDLQSLAAARGLADRVTFLGKQPRATVLNELQAAEIVVLPSVIGRGGDQDGTPVVLVEAMSLGAPVIGSDLGGISEHVFHGQNGLLTPPGDVAALRNEIDRLLGDEALRHRLGDAAHQYATDAFDVSALAQRLVDATTSRLPTP